MTLLHKRRTSEQTSTIDRNTNFIISDKDKDLFTQMKLIVDSGFPSMEDPMLIAMDELLSKKKRKYAYEAKEDGEGITRSVYISFPRYGPIDYITYYIRKLLGIHERTETEEA